MVKLDAVFFRQFYILLLCSFYRRRSSNNKKNNLKFQIDSSINWEVRGGERRHFCRPVSTAKNEDAAGFGEQLLLLEAARTF